MAKLLLIFSLTLLGLLGAHASAFDYPYVRAVNGEADMELSDSVFYKIARSVVFPVNKYHIQENSTFYQELINDVIPEMNAQGYHLESITIRGAASPEGPYKWNQFLGQARMKALFDLIDTNM